jgi:hypothetical protein
METVSLPCTRVYVNTGDPIEKENLMEFRLLYEGELPGANAKARDKHIIRQVFHPQLRRLWAMKANLRDLAQRISTQVPYVEGQTKEERIEVGLRVMGNNWNCGGYHCVPLVTKEMALRCSLDILLLRAGDNRFIFEQGDIDNQVATLFDGLKVPTKTSETGNISPGPDENPFFCLLEDDRLVSEVRVTSEELLMLPNQGIDSTERQCAIARLNLLIENTDGRWNFNDDDRAALAMSRSILQQHGPVRATDAFAVIHVRVNHKEARTFDNYFG